MLMLFYLLLFLSIRHILRPLLTSVLLVTLFLVFSGIFVEISFLALLSPQLAQRHFRRLCRSLEANRPAR